MQYKQNKQIQLYMTIWKVVKFIRIIIMFSVDIFKISDSGRNDVETTIKEALYIKSHKLST